MINPQAFEHALTHKLHDLDVKVSELEVDSSSSVTQGPMIQVRFSPAQMIHWAVFKDLSETDPDSFETSVAMVARLIENTLHPERAEKKLREAVMEVINGDSKESDETVQV